MRSRSPRDSIPAIRSCCPTPLPGMRTIASVSTDLPQTTNLPTASPPMNDTTQPLISLDSIKKVFFTDEVETHALAGVHFSIFPGEYVSISGPSGCGKSTLLSILGLLDSPSEGKYQLNGTAVEDIGPNERARIRNREIGFIFQAFNLIGDLSVFENVELPLTYRDGMSKAERRDRVVEALERVGMAHRL